MQVGDLVETFDGQLLFVTRIGDWETSGRGSFSASASAQASKATQSRNVWGLLHGSIYQTVQGRNGETTGKPFVLNRV